MRTRALVDPAVFEDGEGLGEEIKGFYNQVVF